MFECVNTPYLYGIRKCEVYESEKKTKPYNNCSCTSGHMPPNKQLIRMGNNREFPHTR